MKPKHVVLLVVGVVAVSVLGSLAGAAFLRWRGGESDLEARREAMRQGEGSLFRVGDQFPELELVDLDGRIWRTDDITGSGGALVVCFVTDCDPCLAPLEAWGDPDALSAEGVTIIGLSYNNPVVVRNYLAQIEFTSPVLCDTNRILYDEYELRWYPTIIGLEGNGRIAFIRHGLDTTFTPEAAAHRLAG